MKSVLSWIGLYLTGLFWFAAVGLFVLFATINPGTLKDTLSENNTYQKIVPAALDEAQEQSSEDGADKLPLHEPGIQAATNTAFPSDDLRNKSETVIDSIFAWLEGKTPEPQFRLDFTNNKQVLATEVGKYAENRAAGLPPCTLSDLQAARNQDVFTINCLPPGVAPAQVGREASQEISSNENFLKDPVVTANTLKAENNQTGEKQSDLEPLKSFYQQKPLLSWLLPALIVLLAVAGIMLASDRRRAIKRLARIFLMAAVSFGLLAVALKFASTKIVSSPATDKTTNDIALPLVGNLLSHAGTLYIWFAIISAIIGFGLFVVNRRLRV